MRAVITYHSIDDSGSVISVDRAELSRQLDALLESGAQIVPLHELREVSEGVNAVALTFDDGFRNFATAAQPLFTGLGLSVTVFIVPEYAGLTNAWEAMDSRAAVPEMPLMSWDEMRALGRDSVVWGAHGFSHRALKGLERDDVATELSKCIAAMEGELAVTPRSFAFPYGDFDEVSLAAVAARFDCACTTHFATLGPGDRAHAIPRLDSYYFRGNDMLRRFGTRGFSAWVRGRGLARAARHKLRKLTGNG